MLCDNGTVYTWGKGGHHRLGHGGASEEHSPHPRAVEALLGKRVSDIAVGICHAAARTEDGEVFAWGLNDHGQLGEGEANGGEPVAASPRPLRMGGQSEVKARSPIVGLACGPNQTFVWTAGSSSAASSPLRERRVPFVLDICEETFRLLDQLLDEVWDGGLDGQSGAVPKQEEECVAVGALNLLKLQLFAILSRKER